MIPVIIPTARSVAAVFPLNQLRKVCHAALVVLIEIASQLFLMTYNNSLRRALRPLPRKERTAKGLSMLGSHS